MSEFLNSILTVRKNWKDYPQWEQQQDNKEAQRKELYKTKNFSKEELEQANKYGRTIIDAVDIMDRNSEDKVEDVEFVTGPLTAFVPIATGFAISAAGLIKSVLKAQSFEKKYARQIENFSAQYVKSLDYKSDKSVRKPDNFSLAISMLQNNKKIDKKFCRENAELIKTLIDEKTRVLYGYKIKRSFTFGIIAGPLAFIGLTIGSIIWTTGLQKQAARIARYQSRENELKDPRNFVMYTPDQIAQAEKIASKMTGPQKKKNPNWFKSLYSLIKDNNQYKNWKKNNDNLSNENFNADIKNLTPEQLKQAESDKDVLCRVVRKVNDYAEDYAEHMETSVNTFLTNSFILGIVVGKLLNKVPRLKEKSEKVILNSFNSSITGKLLGLNHQKRSAVLDTVKFGMKILSPVGFAAFILTTIMSIPLTLMLNKYSSKLGRYVAKKELMENPRNFISCDDNELESVKNVKAGKNKQGIFKRIVEDMAFIPKAYKLTREYEHNKKYNLKNKQKLEAALKQVELNHGQLEEAKNLQAKVFNTYEKVDEMSQKYSEDVEAMTDIVNQLSPAAIIAAIAVFPVAIHKAVKKGLLSGAKVIKSVSGIFARTTSLLNTKFIKNIILDLGDHIEKKYAEHSGKKIASIKTNGRSILSKELFEEIFHSNIKNLDNASDEELKAHISKILKDNDPYSFTKLSGKDIRITLKNLDKIIKNFPAGEFEFLSAKLTNLALNNEDFAEYFIKNYSSLLDTPKIRNFKLATGAAYISGSLAAIYLINVYFSELQKRAGRIGTMKAIQSLDDPKYFVDLIQT